VAQAAEPQTLSILLYLADNPDRLIARDELHDQIWHGRAISDWTISAGIKAARRALGADGPRYIKTVHGKGIRFLVQTVRPGELVQLAVAPMRKVGSQAGHDYLSDGLTEDLITDLSKIPGLSVLTRNACFSLRGHDDTAAHLGATHLLTGAIQQSGTSLRINLELIGLAEQAVLWSDRFDGESDTIFAMQDDVTARVVHALSQTLSLAPQRRGTRNPAAYDRCLAGRAEYYLYTPPHLARAQACFQEVIALDPDYAEAHAYLAYCRCTTYVFAWPGSDPTLDPAIEIARRAISLDPDSAVAHARLGWVLGYASSLDIAEISFAAAIALDGNNGEVLMAYGETMNRLAQPARGLPLLNKAFQCETMVPPTWDFTRGHSQILLGDFDRALGHIQPVLDRVPSFVPARVQLICLLMHLGQDAEARANVEALLRVAPRYTLENARRMFPYPDRSIFNCFMDALTRAGVPQPQG